VGGPPGSRSQVNSSVVNSRPAACSSAKCRSKRSGSTEATARQRELSIWDTAISSSLGGRSVARCDRSGPSGCFDIAASSSPACQRELSILSTPPRAKVTSWDFGPPARESFSPTPNSVSVTVLLVGRPPKWGAPPPPAAHAIVDAGGGDARTSRRPWVSSPGCNGARVPP
jgi:hypothetical protein